MPNPPNDRLLQITRLILTLLMALTIFAAVVALLTLPILYFKYEDVAADMAASGIRPESIPWIVLMLLAGVLLCGLTFFFLRHLRRIVDSVSQGDPFVPINADRLRHMAWLALAMQVVLIAITPTILWFDALPHKQNVHHNSDGLSFAALVLALLLFILARVFRVGTAMRDELEGTV
ncbi:MAG TPA: DUF2975 domain-containing protein [Sphingomicrobium sp.]|nr:DUF2975 domain-containing protein [Sphingomicrobium sp.]